MKRQLSGLLALILTLSLCAGCGGSPAPDADDTPRQPEGQTAGNIFETLTDLDMAETVLELDGNAIPADMYLYWLMYTCSTLEYQLNMLSYYGMYTETMDENGQIKWEESVDGTPLLDIVREQAEGSSLSYALIENVAKEQGVELTEQEREAMDAEVAEQIEQAGGEESFLQNLYEMGLSRESHMRLIKLNYLYDRLRELASDTSSALYEAPSDDNAYVDHILLMTVDSATNEPLGEEEIAEKKAKAEELLAQLQETDPAELETVFTQLAEENGEDPGRESGAGYLMDSTTNFVQEFKDAALALKPGEISGIVESDYGYHILLRKELTGDHLRTLAENHLGDYLDERIGAAMETAVRSEKLDGINAGDLYNRYIEALQALHPQEEDQSAADGGAAE
ncbi:MAG: hypothetical protein HDT14_03775 [Oscillibacter sp.]|nr:hypothetical protein [Oscillibacter sp.]